MEPAEQNKTSKFFSMFFALVIGLIIAYVIVDKYLENTGQQINPDLISELTEGEGTKIEPKTVDQLQTSAWIPYWDFKRGLETLKQNPDKFDQVNPVVYELNEDGSLKKTKGNTYKPLQNYALQNNIDFVPSIAMFDHDLFSKVLQDEENLNRHVEAIINEIKENDFDGIDLDYESTKLDDKENYHRFIQLLERKLQSLEDERQKNLILSITVLTKWGDNTYYSSMRETRQVQDWNFFGQYADEIKIMAYDYTSQSSSEPGPIAPLYWIDQVLKKAIEEIPHEKISLGVHTYGYNWAASEVDIDIEIEENLIADTVQADAYTYDQTQNIIGSYPGKKDYDSAIGESIYTYKRDGEDRILIFMNYQGLIDRNQLAADYGIKGVSYWRLGGDSLLKY